MDKTGRPLGTNVQGVSLCSQHRATGSIGPTAAARAEPEAIEISRPRPTRWRSTVAATVASFGGWSLAWLLASIVRDRGQGTAPVLAIALWFATGSAATVFAFKHQHSRWVRAAASATLVCAAIAAAAFATIIAWLSGAFQGT